MLDVLVVAVLRLSHVAMKGMLARGGGGVINVSSVAGFLPGAPTRRPRRTSFLSRWADATYRDQGVRTMALCPGFTRPSSTSGWTSARARHRRGCGWTPTSW